MTEQDVYWHAQIHSVLPGLEIHGYELHQEGLINDVVIVNNEWVIRFTKTKWGRELMETESQLMKILQPRLSLPIPAPTIQTNGSIAYRLIIGEPFLRETWLFGDEIWKQKFADQLGTFLSGLHQIDPDDFEWQLPQSYASASRETWLEIYERAINKLFPLLLPHQVDWVEALFNPALNQIDFFDYQPTVIHGDLVPYHILCNPEKHLITGVIDFGLAGLGDPAADLGTLINYYGESLVSRLKSTYPEWESLISRARFYAQALELQWVLLGLESGEQYWFTSHLGNARDVGRVVHGFS